MKKILLIAFIALGVGAAHAQATKSWSGKVTIDKGGSKGDDKLNVPDQKATTVTVNADGTQTVVFWDGATETWTIKGNDYTWSDGNTKVTAHKAALHPNLLADLQRLANAEGGDYQKALTVLTATTTTLYGNVDPAKDCEKITDKGDCELSDNTVWGLGEGLFALAYSGAKGPRVIIIQQ